MGEKFDLVGHHEGGVEADTELADQFLGRGGVVFAVLSLPKLLTQLGGTGLGQRADQVDHLCAGHTNAVVANGEGTGVVVHHDLDVQIGRVDIQVLVLECLDPQLVQRVGGVRDQLPKE